jgi:UDP-glucose 4-epimerase
VPQRWITTACRLADREDAWQRLAGTLVADPATLRSLGWTPPVATPAGLAALMR